MSITLDQDISASCTEKYDATGIGCFHLHIPLPKGQTEKTFCGIPLDRIFWVDQGIQGKLKDAKTDCIKCNKTLQNLLTNIIKCEDKL